MFDGYSIYIVYISPVLNTMYPQCQTQCPLPRWCSTKSYWAKDQLGFRAQMKRQGGRVTIDGHPGIDREHGFPNRLVSHRRCPSFCIHPSTSPSREPCTRGTRRKNQIISPRQLRINHSVPTPDLPNLLTSCPAVRLQVLSTRAAAILLRK